MKRFASPELAEIRSINWRKLLADYQSPDVKRSVWQIINSVVPYFMLWVLAYYSLSVSYWLTLGICVLAAGFLIRIFIIFHDCGHGSFFESKKANTFVGYVTGILTFTPYHYWAHDHAIHHATTGDLDRRGVGDVYTLTVKEYLSAPRWRRVAYHIMRNPLILFTIGAFIVFVFTHRFARRQVGKRERESVIYTNLAIAGIMLTAWFTIGLKEYLLIQMPIMALAATMGVWLFYVQHQFEDVYWERHENWSFVDAALKGSSFYKLPKLLQWFSGNIGFHHIHHLSPRIPNYKLEQCFKDINFLQQVKPLTLWSSFKTVSLRLWDEEAHRLVSWRALSRVSTQSVE